ncbi:hypothetical protein QL285_039387 [Trifolium repens]|nr:hypothetical protein QL285_039387 [Trifolium repens]
MLCQVSSEATYQRIRHQKLCLITSDSDTCSEGRFVRRTFSATMIEFHHHLTTQKLENQPYPQNSNVSTIVRTFLPQMDESSIPSLVVHKGYQIWFEIVLLPAGEISCNVFKIQGAPPLTINRSGSEVLNIEQMSNLIELLLCENHSENKTT